LVPGRQGRPPKLKSSPPQAPAAGFLYQAAEKLILTVNIAESGGERMRIETRTLFCFSAACYTRAADGSSRPLRVQAGLLPVDDRGHLPHYRGPHQARAIILKVGSEISSASSKVDFRRMFVQVAHPAGVHGHEL
jgi:hypothetical protein